MSHLGRLVTVPDVCETFDGEVLRALSVSSLRFLLPFTASLPGFTELFLVVDSLFTLVVLLVLVLVLVGLAATLLATTRLVFLILADAPFPGLVEFFIVLLVLSNTTESGFDGFSFDFREIVVETGLSCLPRASILASLFRNVVVVRGYVYIYSNSCRLTRKKLRTKGNEEREVSVDQSTAY